MKNICIRFLSGLLAGAALLGSNTALAAEAAKDIPLVTCTINGSVYVKLADAAQAAGFTYTYDAVSNTATINPETASSAATTDKAGLTRNADGSINVPQDGSRYIPQAGDIIRCDDGTNYTITDVSRYDGNMFASGPVGPLPTATCDWPQFDQPELPKAEVRHYHDESSDRIFVRNLYEIRRLMYTLYNAMGEDSWIMQDGEPRLRADGSPWVHIHYGMPEGKSISGFWPWRADQVTESLHARPGGEYYLDVWDVYRNGIFQRTEYKLH